MASSTSVPLTSKAHSAFIQYYLSLQSFQNVNRNDLRSRLEEVDRAYQRELDKTYEQQQAAKANKAGDTDKFQNITVPVVMPQVETSVAYQTSVFLTGDPLFGVVSSPAFMKEALQLESLIEENAVKGGWVRELMMHFRDGAKYNLAPIEVTWDQEVTSTVETTIGSPNGASLKELIWSGNKVKRLDPYNTFMDTRVPPSEVYKRGDFIGYTELASRIELKTLIETLPDKILSSIRPAFESGTGAVGNVDASAMNYYEPDINPLVNSNDYTVGGTNWMAWAGISSTSKGNIDYKDSYEKTTLYCRVLPSEFDQRIPNRNIPQIYKLIIINHQHIIYAEKQTNAHGYLPILVGQPLEDGLKYQTKSLATNAMPFQSVASAYMNSILASRRRAITDRVLYDPSRISSAHINSANPSAKIPVRPAAYGKNLAESVYAFPYREDQASSMQQIQQLLGLANQLAGQNQASQGQFVKGNKTMQEFDTVMDNANGRDQMVAILAETQVFTPMKHILKFNYLQYQGGTTIYNRTKKVAVEIDPVALRKAVLEFRISDGLIPASKILNTDTFSVALQVIGSSPQLSGGYNVAPLFSYLMKTQGADLTDFEKSPEQLAFEQAMAQWSNIAQLLIEKDGDPSTLPPQPIPEQYGYNPAAQGEPSAEERSPGDSNTAVGPV